MSKRSFLRPLLTVSATLLGTTCISAAGSFDPSPTDVCTKSKRQPNLLVLDRKKLFGQLVEKQAGLSPIDLDTTGNGITFERESSAVLDPERFCKQSACGKNVQTKLGIAQVELIGFLSTHAHAPLSPKGGIDTSGIEATKQGIALFLSGEGSAPAGACTLASGVGANSAVASTENPAGQTQPVSTTDASAIPQHVSLRQSVDDLKYSQGDKEFAGLKQATISLTDDYIAKKISYTIDTALGYDIGRFSLDEQGHYIGQIIPFVTYDQKYVESKAVSQDVRVQNASFGVIGDLTFKIGDFYNNVDFYPKFTQSIANNAQIASANFVYTPEFGIPGIDNVIYIAPDLVSFQVTPQLKLVGRDVLDIGSSTTLRDGDYLWIGPRVNANLFGEGIFEGFTYNASYEGYTVLSGQERNIYDFQTSLSYDFGKTKLMSIQLKYEKGRDLDTLEPLNILTIGLGVKY